MREILLAVCQTCLYLNQVYSPTDFLFKEVTRQVFGKDSAWTPRSAGLTRIRVLHCEDGAKDASGVRKSNDQRKPFGCTITRFSFPPNQNFA